MSSLDSVQLRQALAEGVVVQAGTDEPVAIRLRYVGTGTVTSVTVTTATNIVAVTSDGGTDTYAFSTYATVGALADAINKDGIFEAKVLDALRSQATASKLVDGAITAGTDENGVVVWDVANDTSALKELGVCLTAHRNFDAPANRRVQLDEAVYVATLGAAAADSFQIHRRRGTTETQIFGALSVSATETTLRFGNGQRSITGREGDEFIVRVKDGTSIADAAANFVRVIGRVE